MRPSWKIPNFPKPAEVLAQMTPEAKARLSRFIEEHPEWADVAQSTRIREFRNA